MPIQQIHPPSHFISDTHFGHNNILRYDRRPFENVYRMQREIVKRYCDAVQRTDTVLWLGDFALGLSRDDETELLRSLPGRKILVRGNHDRHSKTRLLLTGFDAVLDIAEIIDPELGPVLCVHNPLRAATHPEYRYVVHGHRHSPEPVSDVGGVRRVDCGVVAWDYYPAPYAKVIDLLRGL